MRKKLDVGVQTTIVVFLLLSIYASWFSTGTANNLLQGDDWRFLLEFYKKWLDGTFQFKDWFADSHPIAWHPLVYIFNAEFFSLQRKYGAWIGLLIKMAAGLLLLWALFRDRTQAGSKLLSILFPVYIVLLFFGMNETAEYFWPLLTYESSMTFLCGLAVLVLLDRLMAADGARIRNSAAVFFTALVTLLLMGTLIKLFLVASIFTLAIIAMAGRGQTIRVAWPIGSLGLALFFHGLFIGSLQLSHADAFPITLTSILGLVTNLFENFRVVAFGLAAGISGARIFHYPSVSLNIFVVVSLLLVGYSVFVFYRERMWKITIIPMVLIVYLLLSFLGAIVFRAGEIVPDSWPLYVPRYFSTYHMGWVGVVWILYYKFRLASARNVVLPVALMLSLGICFMLVGLVGAWKTKPYLEYANLQAEIAMCKYANGDMAAEKDISFGIKGYSFSQEAVRFLQDNRLNIFSEGYMGYKCVSAMPLGVKP